MRRSAACLLVAVNLAVVVASSACTRSVDEPVAQVVARPAGVAAIVEATAGAPGLEIDVVVGTDDLVVLRSTARFDTAAVRGHRDSEGAVGTEFDSADPPPLTDFGESWFVDGRQYARDPGASTARPVSGDLADFLFVDGRGATITELEPALEQLLEGWPAATVSDAELRDGRSTHRLRFERADGDLVDVWVDERNRIVAVVRISELAAPLELRLGFGYLDTPPDLPELPPLAAG